MELTTFYRIRHLYRTDPRFQRAMQVDPTNALANWNLNASGMSRDILDRLQPWLERSPEELLQAILHDPTAEWEGMPVRLQEAR